MLSTVIRSKFFATIVLFGVVNVAPCCDATAFLSSSTSSHHHLLRQLSSSPEGTIRQQRPRRNLPGADNDDSRLWSSSDPLSAASTSSPAAATNKLRKKKNLRTFSRYLEVECWKQAELRGLEPVLLSVADACKQITRIVQRAQTDDIYGVAVDAMGNPLDTTNVQGEVQQKLDVLCNTIMLRAFCGSSRVIHAVASEEEDEPRCCSEIMVRPLVGL